MSAQDGTAEIIAAYQNYQNENYVFFASLMPLVYDYLVTFDREVGLFWTSKLTGASALYFATRYIPMLYVILNTVTSSPNLSAEAGLTVDNLQYIAPAVFSGLRAFVLTNNRIAALLIFLLALAPFAVNLFQYHLGISGVLIPLVGCGQTYSITEAEVIIHVNLLAVTAVSRAGSILSDFLLVMATWHNLKTSPVIAELVHGTRASLAAVMLWNGSLYFIILFVLNVLHLGFTLSSILRPSSGTTSYIAEFTNPLTVVLVCRFLLDLQEASRQDVRFDVNSDDISPSSLPSSAAVGVGSVIFARVLGSIGSTIVPSVLVGDAQYSCAYPEL